MPDDLPWTKFLPILLWITGIVGAWIALLIQVIRALLARSVQQIDAQFLDLRERIDTVEESFKSTKQTVSDLEKRLEVEAAALKEESARRLTGRLDALEDLVRTGRAGGAVLSAPWTWAAPPATASAPRPAPEDPRPSPAQGEGTRVA